jgi:hypothetical protein
VSADLIRREIVVLRSRFVPDFAQCDADTQMYGDTVKCGGSAVVLVSVDRHERWVCAAHLDYLLKEQHGHAV